MARIKTIIRELLKNWDSGITKNTPKPIKYKQYLKDIYNIYLKGVTGTSIESVLKMDERRYREKEKRKNIYIVLFLCRVLCFQPLDKMKKCRRVLLKDYSKGEKLAELLQMYGGSIDRINKDKTGKRWLEKITTVWAGNKICFYNQDYDKENVVLIKEGWCLGMCIVWLLCKRNNSQFWAGDRQIFGQRIFTIKDIMNKQKKVQKDIEKEKDLAKVIDATEGIYAKNIDGKLKKGAKLEFRSDSTGIIDNLTTSIMKNPTCSFVLINMHFTSGRGHAMALYRYNAGKNVKFMDPNLGEVQFNSSTKFKEWFPEFIRYQRYKIKKYHVKYFKSA